MGRLRAAEGEKGATRPSANRIATLTASLGACVLALACTPLSPAAIAERTTEGRLSQTASWHPCTATADSSPIARAQCGPATSGRDSWTARLRERRVTSMARRLANDSSTAARRSLALLDLRYRDATNSALRRATSALRDVVLRDSTPEALNDLAVANLAEAQETQSLASLLQSLEAIEHARALASGPAILFNRALILERLGLYALSRSAWTSYLEQETDPSWRADGKEHLDRVVAIGSKTSARGILDLLEHWSTIPLNSDATGDVARARELTLAMMGVWSELRTSPSDSAQAASAERLVRSLTKASGEALLARALDTLENAPPATIDAHRLYAQGYRDYVRGSYEQAAERLQRASSALRAARSPAWCWAELFHALSQVNLGNQDYAREAPTKLNVPDCQDPASTGKALWISGLAHVRRGDYEVAIAHYRRALAAYAGLKERESEGMLHSLLAEALWLSGYSTAADAEGLEALALLAPVRGSRFLPGLLNTLTRFARDARLPLAALNLGEEVTRLDAAPPDAGRLAWSHAVRGRELLAAGLRDSATRSMQYALALVERMPAGQGKQQTRSEILFEIARVRGIVDDVVAARLLEQVLAVMARGNSRIQLPEIELELARVKLATRDTAAAVRQLEQTVALIEERRRGFTTPDIRARYTEAAERAFDMLMAVHIARGHPDLAFDVLERARRVGSGEFEATHGSQSLEMMRRALPQRTASVAYAVLDSAVVGWVLSRDTAWHFVSRISRDSLSRAVTRLSAFPGLEPLEERRLLGALHEALLQPARAMFSRYERLIVVPDREVMQLPIAALWSESLGRFVAQDHIVTHAPNADALVRASRRIVAPSTGGKAIVLVGDPAFDRATYEQLRRLPAARRETAAIGPLYARQLSLTDSAATSQAVTRAMATAQVFHFAGHAIANLDDPAASVLVTAGGALHAAEIAQMRLSNVELAVLSACTTQGARPSHTGAAGGLAASFLRAGVQATVSTIWEVGDRDAEELVTSFHSFHARGMSAAASLGKVVGEWAARSARDGSSVRGWAAFILTGQ